MIVQKGARLYSRPRAVDQSGSAVNVSLAKISE